MSDKVKAIDVDLNQFAKWQAEKPSRSIGIEIGQSDNHEYLKIWVYDYGLQIGQHVTSVDQIDLDAEFKKSFEEKIEAMRHLIEERETA